MSEYTVRGGDSLSAIAQRELGNALRWPAIYESNKALLDAEFARAAPTLKRYGTAGHDILHPWDLVQPGQKLVLPK